MGWKGIITDGGKAIMARAAAESGVINVNAVQIGTGSVPEEDMRTSVALVNQVGTGAIVWKRVNESATIIRITVGPLGTEKLVKEIGIFGTYGGSSYLIALYQHNNGVTIPASSVFPDFVYAINAIWDIDNTQPINITVDSTAAMSYNAVVEEIDNKCNTIIAEEYDPSGTRDYYTSGDWCFHNGKLYEFTSNIHYRGVWNDAYWTERKIGEVVKRKADLSLFADEYEDGLQYAAGQIQIHEGKLYQRKTDGQDNSWTSQNWREMSLEDYFSYYGFGYTFNIPHGSTSYEYTINFTGPYILQIYNTEGSNNGLYIGYNDSEGNHSSITTIESISGVMISPLRGQLSIVSATYDLNGRIYQFAR